MTLNDALAKISATYCSGDFLKAMVEGLMPGWHIETWDCDEYNTSLTSNVLDYIIDEIKDGRTEIKHGEWCTDSCSVYYLVVATRKPKD